MLTKNFWMQAAERAVKSAAQALLLLWGATEFDVLTVDARAALGLAAGAAVLSLLTSIVSLPAGEPASPSAVRTSVE